MEISWTETPSVLASSGGHWSGCYASYQNVFLLPTALRSKAAKVVIPQVCVILFTGVGVWPYPTGYTPRPGHPPETLQPLTHTTRQPTPRIRQDTVNRRLVCILLKCILITENFSFKFRTFINFFSGHLFWWHFNLVAVVKTPPTTIKIQRVSDWTLWSSPECTNLSGR